MQARVLGLFTSLMVAACGKGDEDGTASSETTSTTQDTTGSGEASTAATTPTATATATATDSQSTSGGETEDSTTGPETTSVSRETDATDCRTRPAGQWADCKDDKNKVVLDVCMFEAGPTSKGAAGCLVSPDDAGAAACTVLGCVDDCDCYDVPGSGTATPRCGDYGTGTKACALVCVGAADCPEGMVCHSGVCYWPAPGGGS